ncbi:MAG: hypothetical protein S4CHLAM7_15120 [Chlamydiae bacterium]|nr:hypothetical protein [Chlamydiota bacterium]
MKRFSLTLLSFVCLLLTLAGCHSSGAKLQSFRYYENAKQKPIAAVIPLIMRTEVPNVSWDVSQEISAEIHRRLINRGQIYLNPVQISQSLKEKLNTCDLITLTKADLKELSAQSEYAVFMELLEHQEVCIYPSNDPLKNALSIHVRVRVYDLRGETPKVLLQEIIRSKHIIPKSERGTNYHEVVWGGDSYHASIYGRAHAKLEKDLAYQIENYISISK